MRKNKVFLIILVMLIIILSCVAICNISSHKKTSERGIVVQGKENSCLYEVEYDKQIINILKDDVTISGKAQTNTVIRIHKDVTNLTLEELTGNGFRIQMEMDENGRKVTLAFIGDNNVYSIEAYNELVIKGAGEKDRLTVLAGFDIHGDLTLLQGVINTGGIFVSGDASFLDTIQLFVEEQDKGDILDILWHERVEIFEGLLIDLQEGGIVKINAGDDYYSICAKNIELGENTVLQYPKDAKVMCFDYEELVMNVNGNQARDVVFAYEKNSYKSVAPLYILCKQPEKFRNIYEVKRC